MILDRGGPGGESERLAAESEEAAADAMTTSDPGLEQAKIAEALQKAGNAELAGAYTYLQRAVGVIAVLLPGTLVLGNALLTDEVLLGSISAFYYSPMGNVFVGALCALAVFFLSYNYKPLDGYRLDNRLSRFASVAAVGVAIFPTLENTVEPTGGERLVSTIHLSCAFTLFALLAVFSLKLFTRTGSRPVTPQKAKRNRVYRVCGWAIVGALGLAGLTMVVEPPASWHAFWALETVCVEAFGISWLVKGGFLGILADPSPA